MKLRLKINDIPHQDQFFSDLTTKQLLLTSGYGGGKSYILAAKLLYLSFINRPYDGGLFVPSIPDYKRDMLPLLQQIHDENNIPISYHMTDKKWSFPWTRGKLIVFSCEKMIKGPNLAYAGVNEPGLIHYDRYKEIIGRVRVKNSRCPQINLAGTPEGRSNWLYEHFVENPNDNRRVIYGNTRANYNVSEDYVRNLEENYDSVMLQSYLEGKFVNLNTSMFYYAFTREKNCDESIKYDSNQHVSIGMDFNVDYMTATLWHCDDKNAHCFDEIVLPQNQDTQKLCDAIKARGYIPERCTVFPDTAGKSRDTRGNKTDFQIVKQNGFLLRAKPKAPFFRDRQIVVNNLLDKGRIKINPRTCKTLLRDLEDVEQEAGDYSKIKSNAKLTHASDGMDYMIDILFPIKERPKARTFGRF